MTRKPQQTKRKRDELPDDTSKTRQKRPKASKSSQPSLSNGATVDLSKAWIEGLISADEITQVHAQAASGFGPLGHRQCCPNKFARTGLKPIGGETKIETEVIDISDSEEEVQHVCSQARCKANPYCLNFLGQDKWESTTSGIKVIKNMMSAKSGGDPSELLRKPDIPGGLRNLGATCYANAFIQVWNQQSTFRSAVFECVPPVSEAQSLENSPIFQLQVTFAALSYGKAAIFDPTPLIESLRLDRGEQQDAQEFAKLFLSHLAEQFTKQSAPHLKNIVASQFEGLSVYGTMCHGCGYKSAQKTRFLEIEVALMNKSTLEDCLQETLDSEVLSGDNKYRCPQCDSLQEATRYSEIHELPPVLHFSVQRFVFDLKTLSRKKSKNLIKYPLTIDMARWKTRNQAAATPSTPPSEDIYDLCGVLIHKGHSAYSGHYESQVLSVRAKKWYQFNDEVVTELPRMDENKIDLSSKDCYCLIYARRTSLEAAEKPCAPSESVFAKVEALDSALLQAQAAFHDEMQDRMTRYEAMRVKKSSIYRNWNLAHSTDSFKIVPREDLFEFLRRDFPKESEAHAKSDQPQGDSQIANGSPAEPGDSNALNPPQSVQDIICQHGRVDPHSASQLRLITPASFDNMLELYPELKYVQVCQEVCIPCTRDMFEEHCYRASHSGVLRQFENALEASDMSDEMEGTEHWISKKWLKDWRLQKPKMHSVGRDDPGPHEGFFRADVYCEHDGLTLETSGRVKISEHASAIIQMAFPGWSTFSSYAEPCVVCTERLETNKSERLASLKDAEAERTALKAIFASNPLTSERSLAPGVVYAIISSDWIRSWRLWVNKPRTFDRPGAADNSPFICEHGNLLLNPNIPSELANPQLCIIEELTWEHIVDLHPTSGPFIRLSADIGSEVSSSINVCGACYTPPLDERDTIELSIQFLHSSDKPPTLEAHNVAKELTSRSSNTFPLFSASILRRPRRIKHGGVSGRFLSLRVAKTCTLLELKTQIEAIEKTPTYYQTLYYKGEEQAESNATLQDLGLERQDVLQWKSLAEPDMLEIVEDESDVELVGSSVSKPRRTEARAFQGTLLAGL